MVAAMGKAKEIWSEERRAEEAKQARTDHVATEKGFICERCKEPLPRESWGLQTLCSSCEQAKSNL
jgi:hypothetical protein